MANKASNEVLSQLAFAQFHGLNFRIILVDEYFSFDVAEHRWYEDVSADEVAEGNNYLTGGLDLENMTITEEATYVDASWDNVVFTALGGDIGPTSGALIICKAEDEYDEYDAEWIVGFIEFPTVYTIPEDGGLQITTPTVRLLGQVT